LSLSCRQVYSQLGPHAQRKRRGEAVTIVVAGCVAQQEGRNITRRFPEVDIVLGPQYANRLQELLEAAMDGHQVVAVEPSYQTEDAIPALRASDSSAFVNLIYGCNER
jgi:tRNA-2-methylthio-N6-dimethylallyladenosine synthase